MRHEYDFTSDQLPRELEGHYWLNGEQLSRAFCLEVPPKVADLLDVAMAVYAADRRSLRDFQETKTGMRNLLIRMSLREPERWASPKVSGLLEKMLNWLSEDAWSFEFERRQHESCSTGSRFLFPFPPERPAAVSLFSGGLDSLSGLTDSVIQNPTRTFILVSGYTNERLAHRQRTQLNMIRSTWRKENASNSVPEIIHIAVPFGIHKIEAETEEKSQRTRAFVYVALGIAVALQSEVFGLSVYENGVGALNLPLNETQLGVDNYRGVHPLSLQMAHELTELVLDEKIHIENPFLFRTKAEVCVALKAANFSDIVRETVSCDGFPQRVVNQPQCGFCTSCVLRRESLFSAGLSEFDPPVSYRCDVLKEDTLLKPNQIYGPEAMLNQVEALARCLRSDDPWRALTIKYPQLARVHADLVLNKDMDSEYVKLMLVRMYQSYVREWETFPLNLRLAA